MKIDSLNWADIRSRFNWCSQYLIGYLKNNPLNSIRTVPTADWINVILLQALLTVPSGFLAGLVSRKFIAVIFGVLIFPFISIFFTLLGAFFLQYAISFLFNQTLALPRLYLVLALANVPFMFLRIFYSVLPPIELVGFAFTGILLVVGLVENFQLPKRGMVKLIGLLYSIFLIFWVATMIRHSQEEDSFRQSVNPDSLEILEKEIK